MKRVVFLIFIVLIVLGVTACGFGKKGEPQQTSTKPSVSTAGVETGEVKGTYTVAGEILAPVEVQVVPKMAGRVAAVLVDLGDRVEPGQVLVRLEDEELKAQVKQAEAALAAARANLAKTEAGARDQEIKQAKAALRQAQANFNNAQANLERMQTLFASQAVARQQLDAAEAQFQVAESQYQTAKEQLSLIEEGATKETVDLLKAQVQQAEGVWEYAKAQLGNTIVKAPIGGVVAKRNIDLGEMANLTMPMLTLVQDDPLKIVTYVSQQIVNNLAVGNNVDLKIDAAGGKVQGKIAAVGPAADQAKKGFPVEIRIDNQQGLLKPGMYAEVVFTVAKSENSVRIPKEAVLKQNDKFFVITVDEQMVAHLREVETGITDGKWIEIIAGIQKGEQLVIKGQHLLQDGMEVSVRNGSDAA